MPSGVYERPSVEDRFWSRVEVTGFCWNWLGGGSAKGYGRFWINGETRQAHRVAYELLVGPLPEGSMGDHLCRNRRCVNPDHLDPTGNGENVLRGFGPPAQNARQTHCRFGHELPPKGLYYDRSCRTCRRDSWRAFYHRHK